MPGAEAFSEQIGTRTASCRDSPAIACRSVQQTDGAARARTRADPEPSLRPDTARRATARRATAQRRARRWHDIAVGAVLWCSVFAVHSAAPVALTGGDTRWSVHVAYSLLHERDFDLDEYADLGTVHTSEVDGHRYFNFPWGASIAAAPLVAAYEGLVALRGDSLGDRLARAVPSAPVEKRAASVFTALATLFVWLTLVSRSSRSSRASRASRAASRAQALSVAAAFAFGTSMFSTASRALWSHAPAVFLVSVALYCLQRIMIGLDDGDRTPPSTRTILLAGACGAALGSAWVVRPTGVVPLAVVLAVLFLTNRRLGAVALAGAAVPAGAFVWINLRTWGTVLSPYHSGQHSSVDGSDPVGSFLTGLPGHLVSPGRGLLVWSPFVLLAAPAFVRVFRSPRRDPVLLVCASTVALHWLAIAKLQPWYGGHSIGPRLFADVLPFLMVLTHDGITDLWGRARDAARRRTRSWAVAFASVLFVFAVAVHAHAAFDFSVQAWNSGPPDVHDDPGRIWDWRWPQFLAGTGP
jgi:hypothetical protein